jgi:hypothetical protein
VGGQERIAAEIDWRVVLRAKLDDGHRVFLLEHEHVPVARDE